MRRGIFTVTLTVVHPESVEMENPRDEAEAVAEMLRSALYRNAIPTATVETTSWNFIPHRYTIEVVPDHGFAVRDTVRGAWVTVALEEEVANTIADALNAKDAENIS